MRIPLALAIAAQALPLAGQAWDLRAEIAAPRGQDLPTGTVGGVGAVGQQGLGAGTGAILTVSHRIIRVGPVLKLEWGAEVFQWQANGQFLAGPATVPSRIKQVGLGLGANAQFWVPFTGLAGELGLIERFQDYKLTLDGADQDRHIARPWLRAGIRYNLPIPLPVVSPYLSASYQIPITRSSPAATGDAPSLGAYLGGQGSGQEFERLWALGVGITF